MDTPDNPVHGPEPCHGLDPGHQSSIINDNTSSIISHVSSPIQHASSKTSYPFPLIVMTMIGVDISAFSACARKSEFLHILTVEMTGSKPPASTFFWHIYIHIAAERKQGHGLEGLDDWIVETKSENGSKHWHKTVHDGPRSMSDGP